MRSELELPRKKGSLLLGYSSGSTNSINIEHTSTGYAHNMALAPLRIAVFDNEDCYSKSLPDYEIWLGQLAQEFIQQVGNPLCALKGFVSLAKDQSLPDYQPLIEQEITQIEQALKMFTAIAGSQYEVTEPVDLRELTAQIIYDFTNQAVGKSVWVTLPFPSQSLKINANSDRLKLALTQVLNNALEASKPGDVIDIHLQKDLNQVGLTIINTDHEPWIGDLAADFRPFFTTKPGHSGLGLWLANRILQSYGGQLKIKGKDQLVITTISLPLLR